MAKKRLNQKNQRRIRVENNWDKLFLLHLKKSLYVIIIWAFAIIFHNLIYILADRDEDLLLALAIYVIPVYLLISVVYTLVKHKRVERR